MLATIVLLNRGGSLYASFYWEMLQVIDKFVT